MRVTVGYHHFTTIESGGKKLSLCRDLILIVPSSENELFVKYQTRLAVGECFYDLHPTTTTIVTFLFNGSVRCPALDCCSTSPSGSGS